MYDRSKEIVFPPPKPDVAPSYVRPEPSTVIRLPASDLNVYDVDRLKNAVAQIHSIFPNSIITVEKRIEESATNREKVLAVTTHAPATVAEIAKKSGVKPGKIRGVLSAGDLEFRREQIGGSTAYQFIGKRKRKRNTKRAAANNGEP